MADTYSPRLDNAQWDDTNYKDEWQKRVYEAARILADKHNLTSVVDVGCGSGYKFITYLGHMRTCGVEIEPNLTFCRTAYPEREWLIGDLITSPSFTPDLVICSDVIEHFVEPDTLISYIKSMKPRFVIISTPDRDTLVAQGADPNGQPINPHHVREWNMPEFRTYLSQHFTVTKHMLDGETQIAVCT